MRERMRRSRDPPTAGPGPAIASRPSSSQPPLALAWRSTSRPWASQASGAIVSCRPVLEGGQAVVSVVDDAGFRANGSPMPYGCSSASGHARLVRIGLRIIGAMQPSAVRAKTAEFVALV